MDETRVTFSVFTKPWKMPVAELGSHIQSLGFEGIELPVRPGYQVEPENVGKELPRVARQLADYGIKITSVAGPTDEATMAACAEASIPVIRICVGIGPEGYMATEAKLQKEYDALVPLLDRYGVTLGIQNHCDRCISNAMGLRHLMEKYEPRHIGAVWDAAHNALNGEEPELAIDIIWSHLCMVNLKNAFWRRKTGPEAEHVQWRHYWTSGRQGLASWPRVAAELKRRGYSGVVCLTAEYSDEPAVDRLIAEDIAFAKSLFA
jgi:sugar phosphate isomerase/epimerase